MVSCERMRNVCDSSLRQSGSHATAIPPVVRREFLCVRHSPPDTNDRDFLPYVVESSRRHQLRGKISFDMIKRQCAWRPPAQLLGGHTHCACSPAASSNTGGFIFPRLDARGGQILMSFLPEDVPDPIPGTVFRRRTHETLAFE